MLDANSSGQAVLDVPAAVHAGVLGQGDFTQWKMEVCKLPHC